MVPTNQSESDIIETTFFPTLIAAAGVPKLRDRFFSLSGHRGRVTAIEGGVDTPKIFANRLSDNEMKTKLF